MPRRRSLSPEFFKDEDLATLPFEARLLFQGLWCYADRDGRLEDRPKYLKAEIFPYDKVDVEKLLALLANPHIADRPAKAFIHRYTVDTRQYIEIIEFSKHQKPHPHEPASLFPCLPLHVIASNDNVVSSNDTPTLYKTNDQGPAIGPMTKDQKGKTPKRVHGEFLNVKLTDEEVEKLEARFGKEDARRRIENLSQYIESKGDKYKGHCGTIIQWAGREEKNGKKSDPTADDNPMGMYKDWPQGPSSDELCEHGWGLTPELRVKHGDPADRECGACRDERKEGATA
jgi:hypothetical protein